MNRAVIRLRAVVLRAARDFLHRQDWLEVTTPTIGSILGACEDLNSLFHVDFFGRKAFLVQTGQLYLEAAAAELGQRVYTIGHSYRAESRIDARRLCEFLLMELEARDFSLAQMTDLQEELLVHLCGTVLSQCQGELRELGVTGEHLALKRPFPRVSYEQALGILQEHGVQLPWGNDLRGEDEEVLCRKFGHPIFVTHFPAKIKYFNLKQSDTDPRYVVSSDLLCPGHGEICSAGEREDNQEILHGKIETLKAAVRAAGGDTGAFDWYRELRRKYPFPFGGFGVGFERLIKWMANLPAIADTCEFPRNRASNVF